MPPVPILRIASLLGIVTIALAVVAFLRPGGEPTDPVPVFTPRIIATHPHDVWSFTQGLEWFDGLLLESSGIPDLYEQRGVPPLVNQSSLRLVEPETGELIAKLDDAGQLFAEGVTVYDGRALQLTWRDRVLLVTDLPSLSAETQERRSEAYEGEGWGLCYNGAQLVMSNGSSKLTFRDPESFEIERTVEVRLGGDAVDELNELECVGGRVWANIWKSNTILEINSLTGTVESTVDATSLVPDAVNGQAEATLNGIAYNAESETFWLTGKLWPVIYEVEFVPAL